MARAAKHQVCQRHSRELAALAARSRADLVGAGQSDLEGHDDLVILLRDLRSDYLHESINIVSAELNQARRQCAPRKN